MLVIISLIKLINTKMIIASSIKGVRQALLYTAGGYKLVQSPWRAIWHCALSS